MRRSREITSFPLLYVFEDEMKNLFCDLLPLDHKIKSLVVVDCCFNRLFGQIDLLFYLKSFLLFKIQKRHRAVSNNTQSNFLFKVSIAYAVQCGILNAISKKHFRCSLFVKRIIAIEGTTSLFGLGQTIETSEFSSSTKSVNGFGSYQYIIS